MAKRPTPVEAIRAKCMDCSGRFKAVRYCSCDGVNSTKCPLWPYRFGMRPETASKKFGADLLNPKAMPGPDVPLEELD